MLNKSKLLITILCIVFVISDVFLFRLFFKSEKKRESLKKDYKSAVSMYKDASEKYQIDGLQASKELFSEISGYKDSNEYMEKIDEEVNNIGLYKAGVEAYNNNSYAAAYSAFESLTGYRDVDTYLDKMSRDILEQASAYVESEQYGEAMNLLLIIPGYMEGYYADSTRLYASIEEIKAEKEKKQKYDRALASFQNGDYITARAGFNEVLDYKDSSDYVYKIGTMLYDSAVELYNQKAYKSALDLLESIDSDEEWSGFQEAVSLQTEIREAYINYALSEAEEAYNNSYDTKKAVEILENCTSDIGNDSRLADAIYAYRNNYTEVLANMDILSKTFDVTLEGGSRINEYLTDTYGNTYTTSVSYGGGYISYAIGGKEFSCFKAVVGCPKGLVSDSVCHGAYIKIYGSLNGENTLLYESEEVTAETRPFEISVDVAGYDIIYFQWNCVGTNIWGNWGEYATLFDGCFYK